MKSTNIPYLLIAICVASTTAANEMPPVPLETVTVIGNQESARTLPGSGAVVEPELMKTEVITDINQVLKTVPGVYIREEDGHGLRPNIGIRGATAERSEKITLLEDGVLIAPAPYSNPAAYYFPTALRMHSIEVLKGAPLLREGPQTTGGIVNMISTPVPADRAGTLMFSVNQRGSMDLLLNYGATEGQWSYLLETVQRDHEGYKDIDRSNQDSGFEISDYMAKIAWQNERNRVLLKLQYSEEESNETYLGLTDDDFDDDPDRRYGLSEIDQMDNDHTGINLTHDFQWTDSVSSTVTLYHNEFNRDWFKLSGGGSYIADANNGDIDAQGILDGTVNESGLQYKHNNREYESQGLQTNINWLASKHNINTGIRIHHDEMDRYQPTEIWNQVNGNLVFDSVIEPTGSNNREEEADAISFWVTDAWNITDAFLLNFALRYEDIETERTEYSDADKNIPNPEKAKSNKTDEWLGGISLTYDISSELQFLAGYHQGMSPLGGGATDDLEPETSDNYETGIRFAQNEYFIEAIAFFSDFSNKTELCSEGAQCSDGSKSGSYQTGTAEISGLELQASSLHSAGDFVIPLSMTYTYTEAKTSEDYIDDNGDFVADGSILKDVPENVFSLRAGLEHSSNWNNYLVTKYIDETCVKLGCNKSNDDHGKTESLVAVDWISRFQLAAGPELFLKVENLLDEQVIVSRSPDGARPNKPLTGTVGIRYEF